MYGSEHQKRISNLLIYGFGAIVVGGLGFVFTAMGGGLFTSQAAAVACWVDCWAACWVVVVRPQLLPVAMPWERW